MSSHDAQDEDAKLNELGDFLREQEEAMAAEVDSDPFGPLTDAEQSALTATVLSRLENVQTKPAQPAVLAEVVRLSLPKRRTWPLVATALSVAAAALLVFWPRSQMSELPAYALVLPSPDASHRSADGPSEPSGGQFPRYVLGRELEVLLRPATRVELGVASRAFVERNAGKLEPLALVPTSVAGGAIIFRVPTGENTALSEPTTARLHFVVAPPGTSLRDLTVLAAIPKDAQHLVFPLRLIAENALDSAPVAPSP